MMSSVSKDHGYSCLADLRCTGDEEDCMDQHPQSESAMDVPLDDSDDNQQYTPVKSPQSKKLKKSRKQPRGEEISNTALYTAILELSRKFDSQNEHLRGMDRRFQENTNAMLKLKESVEVNTNAVKKIAAEVSRLEAQVTALKKDNAALREMCLEQDRYKRKWSLRLNGVPEKDGENTKEEVIKILKEVIPNNSENFYNTVDVAHRLGQKGKSDRPRQILMQFVMRSVRDQVWKLSKNARPCHEKGIRFREDFCKEDRESRLRLWPKVEEARKRGLKAFLRDGHAVIDGRVVSG